MVCKNYKVCMGGADRNGFAHQPASFQQHYHCDEYVRYRAGSLRDAIASASAGDTINFSVRGAITLSSGALSIRKNLTISGPGASNLAIGGNNSRVFTIADFGTATVVISALTIRNGRTDDSGGGIFNGGNLTLTDSVVSGNYAPNTGGGIYNGNSGTLTLSNRIVSGNSAGVFGGGISTESGSLLTLTGATVSGNSASVGGGINNHDGTLTLTNSTVSDNSALGAYGGTGGGIYNGGLGGTVMITNSTVSGNSAFYNGGGIYQVFGALTVVNSTISGNSATGICGGCSGGGGIYNAQATAVVRNSTLSGNTSYLGGSIISLYGTTTLKNSILAKGSSGTNCYTYFSNAIVSEGYNLSDDASCFSFLNQLGDLNNYPADLSPNGLQNNGGSTQTIALLATSPALDRVPVGSCTDSSGSLITDQRGVARPQGGACDIGAFELILYPTVLALASSPDSVIAGTAGPVTLAATLTRQDTGGAVSGASITFNVVNDFSLGTAITDANGMATLLFNPASLAVGSHTIKAFFSRQTINNVAFGDSFSPTGELHIVPPPYAAQVQQPIDTDGSSVFNASRGVVPVKFTLNHNGVATCQLPPATISLFRTAGTVVGAITEATYLQSSDSGPNFRIDGCQYIYNLATSSLGTGTYAVSTSIGGSVVGSGTFGLR